MEKTQLTILLVGNTIALVGSLLMVGIGFIRNKNKIVLAQSVMFGIMALANLVLGGFTGVLTNLVSALRNLWSYKFKYTLPVKLVVIAVQIALTLRINNLGLIGWLPILSACAFTWFLDTKSDVGFKILIISTQIPWLIYDFYVMNYSSATFDVLATITNTIGLVTILRSRKSENAAQNSEPDLH